MTKKTERHICLLGILLFCILSGAVGIPWLTGYETLNLIAATAFWVIILGSSIALPAILCYWDWRGDKIFGFYGKPGANARDYTNKINAGGAS